MNLLWRILISIIVVPTLGVMFYLDHRMGVAAPILLVFCILLAVRSTWEMTSLLRIRSFEPRFPLVCLCTVLILLGTWFNPVWHAVQGTELPHAWETMGSTMMVFSLVVLLLFFVAALRFREPGRSMETLSSELLIVTYVGVLLSATAQLRWVAGHEAGYLILGSLIIAAKGGDIGAYTLGRLLGRKKLSPFLSPKKTWWGARGALISSALLSIAWLHFMPGIFNPEWSPCPWPLAALYGIIIGGMGVVGDLCESLIKRDVGQKDSAPLLPGFGGIVDMLDSVLYTGPVAYFMWSVIPLATWL